MAEDEIAPNAEDGMDRVAAIVSPLIDGSAGETVDPEQIAARINALFPWNVTPDVCAVLLFRLSKLGVVERRRVGEIVHYFYVSKPPSTPRENAGTVSKFCEIFRAYCKSHATLSEDINATVTSIIEWDDRIIELFARALPDINSFWEFSEEKASAEEEPQSDAWERTLVANFLLTVHSSEAESAIVDRLASLLIVRDVIHNYRYVDYEKNRSTLVVIMDTSSVLSYIGVSGREAQANATAAFDNAKRMGCRLAVLPPTVAEMSYVLKSMLANVGWERRGASANAIRHLDVSEQVVRDVAANPEKHLKHFKITVLPRTINTFPNEKQFFPDEVAARFTQRISWTAHPQSIEHDYALFVIATRMRGGQHKKNLFDNADVIVTPNNTFARAASSFCLDQFVTNEQQCPVVVSQHAFAAAVWLRAGFSIAKEISVSQLLSSCESVASLHPSILQRIRSTLRRRGEGLEEFEVLMADRRCLDLVSTRTLNDTSAISESSTLELLDDMRGELTKELHETHQNELKVLMSRYDRALAESQQALTRDVEEQRRLNDQTRAELSAIRDETQGRREIEVRTVDERLSVLNAKIQAVRSNALNVIWGIVSLFVGCLSFLVSIPFGSVAITLLTLVYVLMLFRVGPAGRFRSYLERSYIDAAVRREFSRSEISQWGIELKQSPATLQLVRHN